MFIEVSLTLAKNWNQCKDPLTEEKENALYTKMESYSAI
jgi:hypothetical protein